ncbi:MAG: methyltransferase, partial [Thermoplasmata archaeon]
GGSGALLAAALGTHPQLRGILFDLPSAVVDAPSTLSAAGIADRCEIRTGSALEFVPPGGDLYVLSRVLHDWPDEKASTVLTNCRRVMKPGAVLLVIDGVLRPGSDPASRLWLDLVMMVMNGGRERTETEWSGLLRKAGFVIDSIRPSGANQDLIAAHAI